MNTTAASAMPEFDRPSGPARADAYLHRLPAEAVSGVAPPADGDIAALHDALAGSSDPAADSHAWHSLPARLRLACTQPLPGGVPGDCAIHIDQKGRTRLNTMPPLQRASMTSRPWSKGPLSRMWSWASTLLTGGARGQMAPRSDDVVPDSPDPKGPWAASGLRRRLVLLALVILQTVLATYFMTAVLPYHGQHWLERIILLIYAVLFGWVGAGFWTALMGFWVLLLGRDKYAISATAAADLPIDERARTAIIIPICNEDVARVFAGIRATHESLTRTGLRQHFDFYVLSDSYDPDARVAEVEAWLNLCRSVNGFDHIFYRRRTHRIKRKSGNVADWCRRWGSAYRYMVVLDADSVMSGSCLVRLVQLMEQNPGAGIIQTAPRASGRDTAYARIQQFATRVYGPLFTAGLHYWQLGESHYWGHNAILRVAPFMRHCSLSRLPGDGALGGEILSHDFVEAALMRRAGWSVWIAYDLPGSYEEMPPTLLDELKRDRRWCQGNLQNFRLFFTSGLHPAHRAVFMTGVMAYLSAPLWFLFLVLSTALLAINVLSEPQYFTEPYQLFPTWPEWHPEWAISLFSATATLLFLPKVLAALLLICKPSEWRGFGGPLRLTMSVVLEMAFSSALAPIRMLFHTKFVTAALLGVAIQWKSPPRDDVETTWREALSMHWGGTVLGILWAALVYWLNPKFLWWLLPVVGALILSIPLSVWSSRKRIGLWLKHRRLFLIPEESMPPRELRWTRMAMKRTRALSSGFVAAVVDPLINALVAATSTPRDKLPARVRDSRNALVERAAMEGPSALQDTERNVLLTDPLALSRLHERIWNQDRVHPAWPLNGRRSA